MMTFTRTIASTKNVAATYCKCLPSGTIAAARLSVKKPGPNIGREFFTCATRACKYFQWIDESSITPSSSSSEKGRTISSESELTIYTDGSCLGNRSVATQINPAGWAAVILRTDNSTADMVVVEELYGPVVLAPEAPGFLGAEVASNNTAELSAIGEALRWLQTHERVCRVLIRFDSEYAAKSVEGVFNGAKNRRLISTIRGLLADVRKRGMDVKFSHVKGHSADPWNDRADRLANRGARGDSSSLPEDDLAASGSKRRRIHV